MSRAESEGYGNRDPAGRAAKRVTTPAPERLRSAEFLDRGVVVTGLRETEVVSAGWRQEAAPLRLRHG